MTLSLVGLSHHVAPVELRERVTLDARAAAALARVARRRGLPLDLQPHRAVPRRRRRARGRSRRSRSSPASRSTASLYRLHDDAAALHLFRVAAGLDSLVPGEGEILGQVRAAYEAAAPGPLLDRVFRQALGVGKRVRTETAIGESPASVSSAAAALAAQVFGDLARPARAARRRRPHRRARRGEPRLARRDDRLRREPHRRRPRASSRSASAAAPIALDDVAARLGDVDVVVSSTSAPEPVARGGRRPGAAAQPLFFIDIAVPRDVDPAIARARRLLPLRHRRPRGGRRRDARRPPRRGRGAPSSSSPRRRSASGRGARRSTSSRRSRRCARAPRRSAPPSSRRSTAGSATTSGGRSSR